MTQEAKREDRITIRRRLASTLKPSEIATVQRIKLDSNKTREDLILTVHFPGEELRTAQFRIMGFPKLDVYNRQNFRPEVLRDALEDFQETLMIVQSVLTARLHEEYAKALLEFKK